MRSSEFRSPTSATAIVLIVTVAAFVIQQLVEYKHWFPVGQYLYLSQAGIRHGYVWQLITFQFLHANLLHIVFNALIIYFFGREIEDTLGREGFLKIYFGSGVVGGVCQVFLGPLLPGHVDVPVLGASAGALGLLAAFASMFPHRQLTLLLFFVIPVSMQARTLLWISVGLAAFGILIPVDNVAHVAHFGGIVAGLAYVHWVVQGNLSFHWPRFRPRIVKRPRQLVRTAATRPSLWQRPKPPPEVELTPDEFMSREVDPILDKITEHGIQSLTERERQVLEKARARMAKR